MAPNLAEMNVTAEAALFYAFAAFAAISAIMVALSRNIIRMAVALLFTLTGVAGLYFLLSAEFLAAVQLVIYAGGTLILIVFGVMLTSKSKLMRLQPKPIEVGIAIAIGSLILSVLIIGIHRASAAGAFTSAPLPADQTYPMQALGQALLGDFLLPFEAVSVLLLVVMIGAAYLAKARRREESKRD